MNELVKQEGQLAPIDDDPLKFALQQGASVDVIERMMTVRRELKAEAAKEAFDRALAEFQAVCPIIKKTKDGYNRAYRYAPLDEILHQTKGLLREHGFSYTITTEKVGGDSLKAICKVTHALGHSERSEFECPIDNNQKNLMSTPQRWGGASTYAKRYAFCNAFGILTGDEDRDAQEPKVEAPIEKTCGPQKGAKSIKAILWAEAGPKFEKSHQLFEKWLKEMGLIGADETLSGLSDEQMKKILPHVENLPMPHF